MNHALILTFFSLVTVQFNANFIDAVCCRLPLYHFPIATLTTFTMLSVGAVMLNAAWSMFDITASVCLLTSLDPVSAGFNDVTGAGLCGFNDVTGACLCGFNDVTGSCLCGFNGVTGACLCGFNDVTGACLCGFR